ncbi:MAG: hypothetical protein IKF97_01600 [Clostridia bacterium]|nr:hypothetical protein [Clostridia bacterium]
MKQKINSIQEWIPIDYFLENGIIKLKNNKYIKIIKVNPINFNLKSELEKESILNSYKIFLKTCNFNFQILIQSNKENLSKNISIIKNNLKNKKEEFLNNIADDYIKYINSINSNKKSSSKNFYLIISSNEEQKNNEDIIIEELNENFFKIKECISRCGNIVNGISNKNDLIEIIYSFLNSKKYLNK